MSSSSYCLRLDGHMDCLSTRLLQLRRSEQLTDVTLCCQDISLHAHRLVLSAYSSYFRRLFSQKLTERHVVFYMFDVSAEDLSALLEFMYQGSVNVRHNRLQRFIKLADSLKVSGISSEQNMTPIDTAATASNETPCTIASPAVTIINKNSKIMSPSKTSRPDPLSDSAATVPADANSKPSLTSGPQLEEPISLADATDTTQCYLGPHVGASYSNITQETPAAATDTVAPVVVDVDISPINVKTESPETDAATVSETDEGGSWSVDRSLTVQQSDTLSQTDDIDTTGVSMANDFDAPSFPSLSSSSLSSSLPPLYQWSPAHDSSISAPIACPQLYQCPECDKCYTLRSSLLEHLPLHSGLTRCPICNKVSSTLSHLRKHLTVAHQLDGLAAKRLVNSMKANTSV